MGRAVLVSFYETDSFPVRLLHAVLSQSGHDAYSIFFKGRNQYKTSGEPTRKEIMLFSNMIRRLNPDIVGFTVRTTYVGLAKQLTSLIRKTTDAKIIWGGIHPTTNPEECIKEADAVCIGDGEEAIVEYLERMVRGEPIGDIQNIWVRTRGKVRKNPLRPLADLDSLPYPDFTRDHKYMIDHGKVFGMPSALHRKEYRIMASRGCLFSCTYCCNHLLSRIHGGSYFRRRSVDSVIDELRYAKQAFPLLERVVFDDDVFTFDGSWIREFCSRYRQDIAIPFFCNLQVNTCTRPMLRMLRNAGLVRVTLAIQSGSERIRRTIYHRPEQLGDIVMFGRYARQLTLEMYVHVILDNPLEGEDDLRSTLELLLKIPRPYELRSFYLTHFPGTDLTARLLAEKKINSDDLENRAAGGYHRWMPSLDLGRTDKNLFWDILFYLSDKPWMPVWMIRRLSHSSHLRRHPRAIAWALRMISSNPNTVRRDSILDRIRWHIMKGIVSPLRFLRNLRFYCSLRVKMFKAVGIRLPG